MKNLVVLFSLISAGSTAQAQINNVGLDWSTSLFDLNNANTYLISSEVRLSLTYEINDNFQITGHLGNVGESPISTIFRNLLSFGEEVGDFSGSSIGLKAQYRLLNLETFDIWVFSGITRYDLRNEVNTTITTDTQTRGRIGLDATFPFAEKFNLTFGYSREFELGGTDMAPQATLGLSYDL